MRKQQTKSEKSVESRIRVAFILWLEQNWIALLSIAIVVGGHLVNFGRTESSKVGRVEVVHMIESKCVLREKMADFMARVRFLEKEVNRNATDIQRLEAKHDGRK